MSALPWVFSCFALFAAPLSRPSSPPAQACTGCIGNGGTAVASGGTCGGRVEISVTAANGQCKWFLTDEPLLLECKSTQGCKTTIVRSWSGLPTGSVVEFCVEAGDETLCLVKKNVVGAEGSGSSTRTGPVLDCKAGDGDLTFQVESAACGLAAEVTPTCSECEGDA